MLSQTRSRGELGNGACGPVPDASNVGGGEPGARPGLRVICASRSRRPSENLAANDAGAVLVEVRVELKPGVLDAEAESVRKSLGLLGIPAVRRVATAHVYDLEFSGVSAEEARRLAQEAVDRLLANPVIHRVTLRTPPG
jgi:phosphoribosylformylglycinamidine synthase subunit PurS